jgi:hypothetical protein
MAKELDGMLVLLQLIEPKPRRVRETGLHVSCEGGSQALL